MGAEHAHVVQSIAGTQAGEDILEDIRHAVGAEEAKDDAYQDKPPSFGLIAEGGDAEK